MGSTSSTPAGSPADQGGAKSIPPNPSSPDNDSRSSESSALASKGFNHGSGDAQQQQHGLASNMRVPQDFHNGMPTLFKNENKLRDLGGAGVVRGGSRALRSYR